jgi:hypothetical protein
MFLFFSFLCYFCFLSVTCCFCCVLQIVFIFWVLQIVFILCALQVFSGLRTTQVTHLPSLLALGEKRLKYEMFHDDNQFNAKWWEYYTWTFGLGELQRTFYTCIPLDQLCLKYLINMFPHLLQLVFYMNPLQKKESMKKYSLIKIN